MHWGYGLATAYLAQESSVKGTSEDLVGERVSGTWVSCCQGGPACLVGLMAASPCPELPGDGSASAVVFVGAAAAAAVVVVVVVVVVAAVAAVVVAVVDVAAAAVVVIGLTLNDYLVYWLLCWPMILQVGPFQDLAFGCLVLHSSLPYGGLHQVEVHGLASQEVPGNLFQECPGC